MAETLIDFEFKNVKTETDDRLVIKWDETTLGLLFVLCNKVFFVLFCYGWWNFLISGNVNGFLTEFSLELISIFQIP